MAEPTARTQGFFARFTVLKGASRELWLVFVIKVIAIASYALMNTTIPLWLAADFGYGDASKLQMVALWSIGMSIVTLLVGSLTDALGLRRTFFIGLWICIFSRAVMAFSNVHWIALAFGLFPLAIGEALGTPVLVAAVRRYSNTRQRSISFSVFYTMMNVGFLIAGYVFDDVRRWLGETAGTNLFGLHLSTYRVLFLVSLGLQLLLLPLIAWLRAGAEATDEGLKIVPLPPRYPEANLLHAFWFTLRDGARDTAQLFSRLLQQDGFYRLLGFLVLIAFIKLIYKQMDYVYPTFGIRELGQGAPIGRLWALNNWLVILIVPIIGALTQRFSAYGMVTLGSIITALSIFIMAVPPALFQPLANSIIGSWLGHAYLGLSGAVHPYYLSIALFVLLLSVGEAAYSPRVYEYAASIAPKGQEASYGALSYIPLLLAKVMVGSFSGNLLAKYCPEQPPRNSGTMWLIIALVACIAPAGLILLRKYIRVKEAGRD